MRRVATASVVGVGLLLVYAAAAELSYLFVIAPSKSAVFWLPSGVTFAVAVGVRKRPWLWPGLFAALFVSQVAVCLHHQLPAVVAASWGVANLALFSGALLLSRRLVRSPLAFSRTRDVPVLLAVTLGSVVPGALIAAGSGAIWLHTPFWSSALAWATSDGIGILLGAPPLLAWSARPARPRRQTAESVALLALLAAMTGLIFFLVPPGRLTLPLMLVPFLFVAWVAIRCGPRITTLALVMVDVLVVSAATLGHGALFPYGRSAAQQLLDLQLLVVMNSVVMLVLAAAIEEQREARRVAEESLRLRDEFLSVASHELNTPITSLRVSVAGLLRQRRPAPNPAARFYEIIDRQVHRLSALARALLDSTRIRAGRLELDLEELDLAALVRETADRLSGLAARAGSPLEIQAPGPTAAAGTAPGWSRCSPTWSRTRSSSAPASPSRSRWRPTAPTPRA